MTPPAPVFLIGAQKAGSRYLHNLLAATGRFHTSMMGEPHFFTYDRGQNRGFERIRAEAPQDRHLLESSTSSLHNPECAPQIAALSGRDTLIVAMVRDPFRRLVSAYLHLVKLGCETRSLGEALALDGQDYQSLRAEELERARMALRTGRIALRDMCHRRHDEPFWNFAYVANSLYGAQLTPFQSLFPRVLVLGFDALCHAPEVCVDRIAQTLGTRFTLRGEAWPTRNTTRFSRPRALARYIRNLAYERSGPSFPEPKSWLGLARLLRLDLSDLTRAFENRRPWHDLVALSYTQSLAQNGTLR